VINSQQLSFLNRQYSIEIDSLHDRFKAEMIDPWIRRLKEEGEKALLGTIEASLMAAKELIASALLEREDRCKRELDDKENLVGEERVEGLPAAYGNLLAAEEALGELFVRVYALQTRKGVWNVLAVYLNFVRWPSPICQAPMIFSSDKYFSYMQS